MNHLKDFDFDNFIINTNGLTDPDDIIRLKEIMLLLHNFAKSNNSEWYINLKIFIFKSIELLSNNDILF